MGPSLSLSCLYSALASGANSIVFSLYFLPLVLQFTNLGLKHGTLYLRTYSQRNNYEITNENQP